MNRKLQVYGIISGKLFSVELLSPLLPAELILTARISIPGWKGSLGRFPPKLELAVKHPLI